MYEFVYLGRTVLLDVGAIAWAGVGMGVGLGGIKKKRRANLGARYSASL